MKKTAGRPAARPMHGFTLHVQPPSPIWPATVEAAPKLCRLCAFDDCKREDRHIQESVEAIAGAI